uniref:Nucleoprotein n=1 Tax=Schizaphis graminum TaxID=13262 RepID=A0A2S2PT59_SCHGA
MSTQEVPETASSSLSECNISEPTPIQSQQTYQEAINEVKLSSESIKKCMDSVWAGWETYVSSGKAEAYSELMRYVPSWLQKNYEPEFDPKVILSYIAAQSSNKIEMDRNIDMLVKLGIEKGNNLEKVAIKLSPKFKHEFERLRITYNLVSKAKSSKSAVTLSRICESVPILTCLYLKNEAENPIVSFESMEKICKNYPRVMMTSAFAYLIPNKEDEFCLFLKNAHLLHQYQFFATISRQTHPNSSDDIEDDFISKVYASTQAAIIGSHIEYDVQMKFLKENDLIVEGENEITVTERVLEAKKLWDEKVRQHEINQQYSGEYEDGILV